MRLKEEKQVQPYRILLADDHIIFREMITKSLQGIPGLEIVGEVGDGLELLASIKTLKPHLIILDISMPRLSGLEAAAEIKRRHPKIKILLLTMHRSKDYLSRALELGVDGYLLKENAFHDLITAIETIREGKKYISTLITQQMMNYVRKKSRPKPDDFEPLSAREIEVLKYFAEGKSDKDIAELLKISQATVRVHGANIKKKLSMRQTADLVKYALRRGYTSLT
jgi:DNA-binding NarL/FixJ family response regulator